MTLTLISRAYCHLCHEMERELRSFAQDSGCTIDVVDVDAIPELVARYDELVPVLLHGDEVLCHYFFDATKVRDYLRKIS